MISLIIFTLAPMCQALMDALVWRFGWIRIKAISRRPEFWNVNYIAANHIPMKTIGGWKFNGWHCTQSAMIFLSCCCRLSFTDTSHYPIGINGISSLLLTVSSGSV
jgi:hypothetical protein